MARCIVESKRALSLILIHVFLLTTSAQLQEESYSRKECGGCWESLDDSVNIIVRSLTESYTGMENNDRTNDDEQAENLMRESPHEIFRRSTAVSTSLECRACWVVLHRLKSYVRPNDRTDFANYGRLVKKTMMNNGW